MKSRLSAAIASIIMALGVVLAAGAVGASGAWAADARTKNQDAEAAREAARQKAKDQIGYPDTYDMFVGGGNRGGDAQALSAQIARLAAILHMLAQGSGGEAVPSAPGMGLPASAVVDPRSVYGPDGPTPKSARLLLEYRLMVAGNPRLKIGEVREDEGRIIAKVVTVDGSLVEEFFIDKNSGAWTPVR